MDSPALATGNGDLQVDVSKIGTMWGPNLTTGNARMRRAVNAQTIIEGEAGVLHVVNEGSGTDRNAYTGRVGAIWRSEEQRLAASAGIGGGTSQAAGSWGSFDLGAMVTGRGQHVRPVLGGDVGYSAAFDRSRTFTVREPDGSATELRIPRNIIAKLSVGLEIGDQDASLLIGLALVKFYLLESSVVNDELATDNDVYVAAGFGIRLRID